ncbi:MAG: phosphatase PAP2 family protein [Acidobacteriota bacterium]|nr:phosphatase PAP2 family protein [Acidobacteriota bacterium]
MSYFLRVSSFFCVITCGAWAQTTPALPEGDSSHAVVQELPNVPSNSESSDHSYELPPGEDPQNRLFAPFFRHLVSDQKEFWTSPVRFRTKDLRWMVPVAGLTAGLIASDSWMAKQVPDKPNQLKRSKSISNYGAYSLIGIAGGSYLLGQATNNEHLRETGFLSGEAALNSTALTYLIKSISQRPRPLEKDHNGTFFQGGASFPSEHSAIAWAAASVWAHEYPGTLSQILAYGVASGVTLTRVTGKQHFASDAVIGSLLGWYFGRQAYRAHHDKELGGSAWGTAFTDETSEHTRNPEHMASPYVPLDSWIYPALERLAALGYMRTAYLGMRPWTRMECARLLSEAQDVVVDEETEGSEGEKTYSVLKEEFAPETARWDGAANVGAQVESLYTRVIGISGTPLRDGYHFGQTITNDYGRPYWNGVNNVTGVTASAVAGPLAFYVRGEYQHAPATPSDGANVLQATASADGLCQQPQIGPGCTATVPVSQLINGRAAVDRFHLLEGNVSATFLGVQLSFGKQSQWMGPGESGSLLFSDNAEPILMLKIDNVSPYKIPLLSKFLGPVRTEYFIGQLDGQQWEFNSPNLVGPGHINPQPFLDGYKISFKPTENLEVGMGITAQFAGPGLPFTWHNFLRTFYSHNRTGNTVGNDNPGKRISTADFSYRVPGMRNWLTFYMDAMVVDEISPLGSTRATVNPGIYIPQMPRLPKLELRAEGIHEPLTSEFSPGFVYYGLRRYRSGYTNDGQLIGNWIGRAGLGGQGWLTYRFSPMSKIQAGYRHQEVSKSFIGGGRLVDYSVNADVKLPSNLVFSGTVQYEQWRFPILASGRKSDITAFAQLAFYPHWGLTK